jgi:hypothetical protein
MDNNAVTDNWLRPAVDAIADRIQQDGKKMPVKELEAFIQQCRNNPAARRIAYELLTLADPAAPDRLLPTMLDDPSIELRREAVAVILSKAEKLLKDGDKAQALVHFNTALKAARDQDQVDACAKALDGLGVKVDLVAHFGLIQDWYILAPFDSTDGVGYKTAYPPESKIHLDKTYEGKGGAKINWLRHQETNPRGLVDLNKLFREKLNQATRVREAVAYAYTEVESPEERLIEIRCGSATAVKIFLNGKQVFAREEYHHGMSMDQHLATVTLKKGKNTIVLKICQNNQNEQWAQTWAFSVRLCDAVGTAVPFRVALPAKDVKGSTP